MLAAKHVVHVADGGEPRRQTTFMIASSCGVNEGVIAMDYYLLSI